MARKPEPSIPVRVSEREKRLVELMRGIEFGELRVSIEDYQPVCVEELRRSVDLRPTREAQPKRK